MLYHMNNTFQKNRFLDICRCAFNYKHFFSELQVSPLLVLLHEFLHLRRVYLFMYKTVCIFTQNLFESNIFFTLLSQTLSKRVIFIYFNENSLKVIKNAYFFILKALFVITIFNFHMGKGLIRKLSLISKFMTFITWKTNNYYAQIPGISKVRAITKKFGNVRNIFFKNHAVNEFER